MRLFLAFKGDDNLPRVFDGKNFLHIENGGMIKAWTGHWLAEDVVSDLGPDVKLMVLKVHRVVTHAEVKKQRRRKVPR